MGKPVVAFTLILNSCVILIIHFRLYLSDNNALLMDNQMRISLVYFRTGYSPENYASEFEWNARRKIELSDAIKCPCIGLQVANTKKVQQVLLFTFDYLLLCYFILFFIYFCIIYKLILKLINFFLILINN